MNKENETLISIELIFKRRHILLLYETNFLASNLSQVVYGAHVHAEHPHMVYKRSIDHPVRILLYYDESVYR